jgi:hypothetical protein
VVNDKVAVKTKISSPDSEWKSFLVNPVRFAQKKIADSRKISENQDNC